MMVKKKRMGRQRTMLGSIWFSALLGSSDVVEARPVVLSPEEWDQRLKQQQQQPSRRNKRRRQLIETRQFIEAMQMPQMSKTGAMKSQSSDSPASSLSSSSQSIQRALAHRPSNRNDTKPKQKREHEIRQDQSQQSNQQQKQQPRHPTDVCERAVQSYASEGGNCTCMYDPETAEIVTLDCHFPTCQECITVGQTEICATISTRAVLLALGSSHRNADIPAEASYTECYTYTKGRFDTLCYTEFLNSEGGLFDECFLNVNGEFCNSCRTDVCGEFDMDGLGRLDCSNIHGGNEWDFCQSGGVFDPPVSGDSAFLAFADRSVFAFDTCSSDPIVSWKPFEERGENVDYEAIPRGGYPTINAREYKQAPTVGGNGSLYSHSHGKIMNNAFAAKKRPKGNIFWGMEASKMKTSMRRRWNGHGQKTKKALRYPKQ